MARRLTAARPAGRAGRRIAALALLALPVLLLHGWLGETIHALQQDWGAAATMPPRMNVSFVRELKAAAPPRAARLATLPKPRQARPGTVKPLPALPEPETMAEAASAPASAVVDTVADATTPAEPAASAAGAADAASGAAASALPGADGEPGPEWPLSTQLDYVLSGNYRGAVHGDARVQWLREGRRYQVHLDVNIGPSLAPLIARRMSSEGVLTPLGISPRRYDEETRVLFGARRRFGVLFDADRLEVQLGNGRIEAAPPGVQDASSQFVQLTWLFLTGREPLRAGHAVELPLVLPKRQYRWRYDIVGEERLETPMGPLDTWYLKPHRPAVGSDLTAEVWVAPTLQYLPVRLRIRQDEQNYVDLMLKAPPLQAER